MFTIVCCYNNKQILDDFLLDSLKDQTKEHQLLLIDNTANEFSSVAKAYNRVLSKIEGECVLFCHQDIHLKDSNLLEKIEEVLASRKNALVGLCGIDKTATVYSNLKYKDNDQYITRNRADQIVEVESVDECIFGMSKELLDSVGAFDEDVCDNWHLYATDYSFRVKQKGGEVLVLPFECYHKSDNTNESITDKNYLSTLRKIRNKYKGEMKKIYSTCYVVGTGCLSFNFKILKTSIKNKLR